MSDPINKIKASRLFFDFTQNTRIFPLENVLDSAIFLLENYSPYRDLVLEFLTKLFRECCRQYCLINIKFNDNNNNNEEKYQIRNCLILMQFIKAIKQNDSLSSSSNVHRKYSSSNDEINKKEAMIIETITIEDCPLSPPKESASMIDKDFDKEELSLGNNNDYFVLIMNSIEKQFMPRINAALMNLLINDNNNGKNHFIAINEWALILAINISFENSNYFLINNDDKNDQTSTNLLLMKAINFWKSCTFMKILIDIIFNSIKIIKPITLLDKMLKYSPHSDWIVAHLLTTTTTINDDDCLLKNYLELLINHHSSSTNAATIPLLSYISEHNPQAIANCSKSNIPFLLNICTYSKPLLDLLANDIVKKVDIQLMNEFAQSAIIESNELDSNILYCILNASNSFELLKIAFDLIVNPESSEQLTAKILNILSLMVKQLHSTIYRKNIHHHQINNAMIPIPPFSYMAAAQHIRPHPE